MNKLTIDLVQREFDNWRASRTKMGKIPGNLWEQALKLLNSYPIGEITKKLRLSGGQLAAKRKSLDKNNQKSENANFLELNIPSVKNNSVINEFDKLEIKRVDGSTLAITQCSEKLMIHILNNFMQ